jgi:hypothetical protein
MNYKQAYAPVFNLGKSIISRAHPHPHPHPQTQRRTIASTDTHPHTNIHTFLACASRAAEVDASELICQSIEHALAHQIHNI